MKKNKYIIISSFTCLFYFTLFVFTCLVSCAKEEKQGLGNDNREGVQLTVNVAGVRNVENGLVQKASMNPHVFTEAENFVVNKDIYSSSSKEGELEFEIISSSKNISNFEYIKSTFSGTSNTFQKLASSTPTNSPMNDGVTYLILVYNADETKLIDVREGVVGTPISIWVNETDDFKWYAYSFNNNMVIPIPDANNPQITTSYDSPLLFAKGEILQSNINVNGTNALQILFTHMLSKLEVELDTRHMYANMIDVVATFEGSPIQTGIFNVKNGSMNILASEDVGNIQFRTVTQGSTRMRVSSGVYYTANTSLEDYSVRFTKFLIQYPNRPQEDIVSKLSNSGVATFVGFTPYVVSGGSHPAGKLLLGTLRPYLKIGITKFLTYGSNGLAANAGSSAGQFLRTLTNIGLTSKYIRIENFNGEDVIIGSSTSLRSKLEGNGTEGSAPDILIASLSNDASIPDDDIEAIISFINTGGVTFLLTESTTNRTRSMLSRILDVSSLSLSSIDGQGALYSMPTTDPDVLNGVFGDARGLTWGNGRGSTIAINNINDLSKLVVYTRGSSINYPSIANAGITAFRIKSENKHVFFVGGIDFLSGSTNPADYSPTVYSLYPYRVNGAPSYFPILRTGYGFGGNGFTAGEGESANSLIFANAFAWLVERAYFYGRSTGQVMVNEELIQDLEENEKSWKLNTD